MAAVDPAVSVLQVAGQGGADVPPQILHNLAGHVVAAEVEHCLWQEGGDDLLQAVHKVADHLGQAVAGEVEDCL